jgi:hypothetical protein
MSPSLIRASPQTPSIVVAGIEPTPIFPGWADKPAFWISVSVLDMHTSTYVYVGNSVVQADGLFSKTDFVLYDVPPGYDFNAADYYIISDGGDAEVAVVGMFPPLPGGG